MNTKILFAGILFLYMALVVQAQVTIGSNIAPSTGALLDLKEYDDVTALAGGRTATKGLGLPRVKLIRLQSDDISETIDSVTPGSYTGDHTGVIVYHIDEGNICSTITSGAYVWDGGAWQSLGDNVVKNFVDNRDPNNPEEYKYASFGSAGEWMLENMRATTYQQGGVPPILKADRLSGESSGRVAKRYIYPFPNPLPNPLPQGATGATDGTDTYYFEQQRIMGLLYTIGAAMNYADSEGNTVLPGELDANSEEESGSMTSRPVGRQGICPNGWHIPSDIEWNRLEEEIYNNPEKYSTYPKQPNFVPMQWDIAWNLSASDRGSSSSEGHGYALISQCDVIYAPNSSTIGKSFPIIRGGFNALLVGDYSSFANSLQQYGTTTSFMSDSNIFCVFRQISSNSPKVLKEERKPFEMGFVRCKKN